MPPLFIERFFRATQPSPVTGLHPTMALTLTGKMAADILAAVASEADYWQFASDFLAATPADVVEFANRAASLRYLTRYINAWSEGDEFNEAASPYAG